MGNNIFDSDQSRELFDLISEVEMNMVKKTMIEKVLKEKEAAEQQPITESSEPTGTEQYVHVTRDHISKKTDNRKLTEKTDLLAGDESVTKQQLQKSNIELWQKVQTSLASLGGGGLGAPDVLQMIAENPSYDNYTDSDYAIIAGRLNDKLVLRAGDSMFGTLHLNHNDNSSASGNIPILKLDPPPGDSAYIGVFTQNDFEASANTPSILALRLYGYSPDQKFVVRTGLYGADSRGDVFEISASGDMAIKSSYTVNYSQFMTKGRTVSVEDAGGNFVAKTGTGVITNSMRTWDSDFQLRHYAGGNQDLKLRIGEASTELWNDTRIHGSLYVDDSGTIAGALTVGGEVGITGGVDIGGKADISGTLTVGDSMTVSGDLGAHDITAIDGTFTGDVSCSDFEASNADVSGALTGGALYSKSLTLRPETTTSYSTIIKVDEQNGTHTLGEGYDIALLGKVDGDIDEMAIATTESKVLRMGFKDQDGNYVYGVKVGTGDVTSTLEQRGRSTEIKWLQDPSHSRDAVPLGYLTNSTFGVNPSQIGDSAQRTSLQSSFATPVDSTDSSGGVGTFFFNTVEERLEIFRDSEWQPLITRIDASQLDFSNIPTSDPGIAGRLWNHNGDVHISAG